MRIRMNKRQMGMILAGAIAASMLIGTTAAYAMPGFGDAMETASEAARAAAEYAGDAARMAANDYVFPQSSSEYLIRDDLEGKTGEELRIARNEIYARHGRRFNDKTLQWYFDAKSWYQGTVVPGDFKESRGTGCCRTGCGRTGGSSSGGGGTGCRRTGGCGSGCRGTGCCSGGIAARFSRGFRKRTGSAAYGG